MCNWGPDGVGTVDLSLLRTIAIGARRGTVPWLVFTGGHMLAAERYIWLASGGLTNGGSVGWGILVWSRTKGYSGSNYVIVAFRHRWIRQRPVQSYLGTPRDKA